MFKGLELSEIWDMLYYEIDVNECIDYQEAVLEIEGAKYTFSFEEVETADWEDEGKYSQGGYVYRVAVHDMEGGFVEDLDLYVRQWVTRCGSYFSEYYYEYDSPYRVKLEKKIVEVEEWVSYED